MGWVNFVSTTTREVRSLLYSHVQQSYIPIRRGVLARANGCQFAYTHLNAGKHYSPEMICRR